MTPDTDFDYQEHMRASRKSEPEPECPIYRWRAGDARALMQVWTDWQDDDRTERTW